MFKSYLIKSGNIFLHFDKRSSNMIIIFIKFLIYLLWQASYLYAKNLFIIIFFICSRSVQYILIISTLARFNENEYGGELIEKYILCELWIGGSFLEVGRGMPPATLISVPPSEPEIGVTKIWT